MPAALRNILLAALALAAAATGVRADGETPEPKDAGELRRAPVGTIARQLEFKFRLLRLHGGGSLTASLDHAEEEWRSLSPDQRELFRRKTLAYLRKNPEDRRKLLKMYREFLDLNKARRRTMVNRARWLEVVVKSLTPEQRKELLELSAKERAAALLERKNELIRAGKLKIDDPTTHRADEKEGADKLTQPASE